MVNIRIYETMFNFRNIFHNNPHLAALILARGGSKGIVLKNIQTVGGQTLLGRALREAKEANFQSIWVSTDHLAIVEEADKCTYIAQKTKNYINTFVDKVNIHWRKPETATDEATSLLATTEFLEAHPEVDIIALIQCTSPFLKRNYLEQAKLLVQEFDCVFSVSR